MSSTEEEETPKVVVEETTTVVAAVVEEEPHKEEESTATFEPVVSGRQFFSNLRAPSVLVECTEELVLSNNQNLYLDTYTLPTTMPACMTLRLWGFAWALSMLIYKSMHIQHIKSPDCPSHYNHYLSIYLSIYLSTGQARRSRGEKWRRRWGESIHNMHILLSSTSQ